MHACGHDGHSAALLGFARRIKDQKLKYNVILIFQNSEENGSGGKAMYEYLKCHYQIDAIFGFHIMPFIKKHHIVSSNDTLMYASEEINIDIHGKMMHVGMRELGIDSIKIASELIQRYASIDHQDAFIHIGEICGGNARNVVCDHIVMKGTLRAKNQQCLKELKKRIMFIHRMMNKHYKVLIHMSFQSKYPAVINDKALYHKLQSFLPIYTLDKPYMLSEDFSYYQSIPSVFMFIGTGTTHMLHTPQFDFDESILMTMIDTYEKILNCL